MANSSVCCSVDRESSVVHVINAWLKEFLRVHDVLRTISGAVRNGAAVTRASQLEGRWCSLRRTQRRPKYFGFCFISVSYSYLNLHFIVLLAFFMLFLKFYYLIVPTRTDIILFYCREVNGTNCSSIGSYGGTFYKVSHAFSVLEISISSAYLYTYIHTYIINTHAHTHRDITERTQYNYTLYMCIQNRPKLKFIAAAEVSPAGKQRRLKRGAFNWNSSRWNHLCKHSLKKMNEVRDVVHFLRKVGGKVLAESHRKI